jgi:subtilisin family serine protease
VVASAGNNAQVNSMNSPACASKVISVGATYDDNYSNCEHPTLDSFSYCTEYLFGICVESCTDNNPSTDDLACFSNNSIYLDVTAPGCLTYSASNATDGTTIQGNCGTSMAAPHVTGLSALILSANPTLTPAEVRQIIRDGAIDMGDPGFDPAYGYGRIDAINSLSLIQGCDTEFANRALILALVKLAMRALIPVSHRCAIMTGPANQTKTATIAQMIA